MYSCYHPVSIASQVPPPSAHIPRGQGALALSSHSALTLPQEVLGLVRVEVLGLNQHHQEAVGSGEVADGEKDLPSACRRLLKQKRGCRRGVSFRGASGPLTNAGAGGTLGLHPRNHLFINAGFSTLPEGRRTQINYMWHVL